MDFHDFPMFLGKSGMDLIHPHPPSYVRDYCSSRGLVWGGAQEAGELRARKVRHALRGQLDLPKRASENVEVLGRVKIREKLGLSYSIDTAQPKNLAEKEEHNAKRSP